MASAQGSSNPAQISCGAFIELEAGESTTDR